MEAKKKKVGKKSEMMKALDRLLRVIAVLLVPFGFLLFWKQHWIMALALSVMRLGKGGTVVYEMSCIETLARVDVLCVDKTGTITEPRMEVSEVEFLDEEQYNSEFVTELLRAYYTVMETDNETAAAIRRSYKEPVEWKAEKCVPFQSAVKWSGISFGSRGTYVIGAPEVILRECPEELSERLESYAGRGERVLLLAEYKGELEEGKALSAVALPTAFIVIANNIRKNAKETFRYFKEQGVTIKVISGDSPAAVARIAGHEAFCQVLF